jgi:hypothetical protein
MRFPAFRRLLPLALVIALPLALTACDAADDEEDFSETVRDVRVEFSFSDPDDLTGFLGQDDGDDVLSRLRGAVPGNSTLTGVRITRVKVDLLSPPPPDYDIGDLNSVQLYFVNGGDRQLVADGSGFTVGSMQSETTLTIRNNEVGSLVRDGLQIQAGINADPDRLFRVEIEFDAEVSFN